MFILLLDIIMRYPELKSIAIKLRNENKSYGDIAGILGLSRQCVRNLVIYKNKIQKKKRGTKNKIGKSASLSIKRAIAALQENHEKVNSSKIKKNCGLDVSISTVQRHLNRLDLKYKKISQIFILKETQGRKKESDK